MQHLVAMLAGYRQDGFETTMGRVLHFLKVPLAARYLQCGRFLL